MTSSINSIVSSSFIQSLLGAPSSKVTYQAPGSNSNTGGDTLAVGLRRGAQTFAAAVQNLNTLVGVVGLADRDLAELEKITDKLVSITELATQQRVGRSERGDLNADFRSLAQDFQDILFSAEFVGVDYLTREGLQQAFASVGLDPDSSESIRRIFDQFIFAENEDKLADEGIQGDEQTRIPPSAFGEGPRRKPSFSSLFDGETNILTAPAAYTVLNDLRALKDQISSNREVLATAQDAIGDNLSMVRAAGFGLLDFSRQLNGQADADDVAQAVRERIRRDAPTALMTQIENLQSLAVAALVGE